MSKPWNNFYGIPNSRQYRQGFQGEPDSYFIVRLNTLSILTIDLIAYILNTIVVHNLNPTDGGILFGINPTDPFMNKSIYGFGDLASAIFSMITQPSERYVVFNTQCSELRSGELLLEIIKKMPGVLGAIAFVKAQ